MRRLAIAVAPTLMLVLAGCMAGPDLAPPDHRGGAGASTALSVSGWWEALEDAPLSALIARGLLDARSERDLLGGKRRSGQRSAAARRVDAQLTLSAEIARRYIDLRAQQSVLVLLARREELDDQLVAIARQRLAGGTALQQMVEAAQAQLAATQADQAHVRADVAALRDTLAILTGSATGALDSLPGGAIPLPPGALVVGDLSRLGAARVAEGQASAQAAQARAVAAVQAMRVRAGALAPADAIDADRQALEALQAEQQARAAMSRAYVALAMSSGLGWQAAPGR